MRVRVGHDELAGMLQGALGVENARHCVAQAANARGLGERGALDGNEALTVLADLARRSDLVGIAASLAHTRLELRLARAESVAARTESQARASSDGAGGGGEP